jgi:hypothetical protein
LREKRRVCSERSPSYRLALPTDELTCQAIAPQNPHKDHSYREQAVADSILPSCRQSTFPTGVSTIFVQLSPATMVARVAGSSLTCNACTSSIGATKRAVPPRTMYVRSSPISSRIRPARTNYRVVRPPRRPLPSFQADGSRSDPHHQLEGRHLLVGFAVHRAL